MSEYGFRKIRREIHLDAAHRNTLNRPVVQTATPASSKLQRSCASGCVSAGAAEKCLTIDRRPRQTSGF